MILKVCVAGALSLALSQPDIDFGPTTFVHRAEAVETRPASSWFMAFEIAHAPADKRGPAVVGPVYFVEQPAIDSFCGGKDQVIACAKVDGGWMVLPNPCQDRFAGESYATLVCHEKGHSLGWSHG